MLGNGVEDEVAVDRESATTNYGDVRIQIRETGQSSWDSTATGYDEQVVSYDTLTTQITGREDGERYEVRARTETEHVTGAWTDPVAITTEFPGAQQLVATGAGETSVDLEWEDVSDNEDGTIVGRQELIRGEWTDWREIADLPPTSGDSSTVTYTDSSVLPDTTYRYRVVPYTEHTSAASNTDEATTDDDGVRTDRVPAQGWHVVLERDDGTVIEPTIVGEPTMDRKLNDLPTCEIPVAQHERWRSDDWGGADMRVYHDGTRQPIEELRRPRDGPGQTTLIGRGGVELEERVTVDVIEREAHLVAEDVLQDATDYARHVDDPAGDTSADVLQEETDTESEWLESVGSAADQPWTVRSDGHLEALQTAGFAEAETADSDLDSGTLGASDESTYSGGEALRFEIADLDGDPAGFAVDFETEHDIPLSEIGVAARVHYTGDGNHHAFAASVDGHDLGIVGEPLNITNDGPEWDTTTNSGLSGTLDAGQHTLEVRGEESASDSVDDPGSNWDCVAWVDTRYDPGLTETVENDVITGPDEFPEVPVETGDITTVRQIVGGRLDITSGMDAAEFALSIDNGTTWPVSATDATTVEGSFSEGSDTLRARLTLSGFDADPTTSPAGRTAPQSVDSYSLFADLDDTPLLVNRSFSGPAIEIVQNVADYANAISEVTWDESAGSIAVEWTMPGQRTASVDPDLVDYSAETDYGSIHRKAVIKGTTVPASTDSVAAQHDTWVSLDHEWLAEVGETVTSSDGATTYDRGVDYELRPNAGELQALSTGSISDGETLSVEYDRHIVGTYESPEYDGTYPVLEETLPAVTTQRNAEQAALTAVRVASEPITTASVTVSGLSSDVDLVDALSVDALPVSEALEQWDVSNSPRETTVQLGSRDPVEETLSRLNQRLSAVSRKV